MSVAGWPKFAMHAFVLAKPDVVVVASLVPASATLPDWLAGSFARGMDSGVSNKSNKIETVSSYPFGDNATITVTAAKAITVLVRIPGWASAATVDGKKAANGTLVAVHHAGVRH
eukprot:SAG31_NODE_801_length_12013_cov_23.812070_14_plen_115_part_00